MINKQNLWFVTLFSLILILGIYYVSIDDEVANVLKSNDSDVESVIEIDDADELVALEVSKEEEKQTLMEEYQNILLDTTKSAEEKSKAYEDMQNLNKNNKEEDNIKNIIKEKFELNAFIKIKDNTISIVVSSDKHDKDLANSIIREIQKLYKDNKYITVKFNK